MVNRINRPVDYFGMPKRARSTLTPDQIAERAGLRREKARLARLAAREAARSAALEVAQVEVVQRPEWAPLLGVWS